MRWIDRRVVRYGLMHQCKPFGVEASRQPREAIDEAWRVVHSFDDEDDASAPACSHSDETSNVKAEIVIVMVMEVKSRCNVAHLWLSFIMRSTPTSDSTPLQLNLTQI